MTKDIHAQRAISARLTDLRAKLRARTNKPGYEENCAVIRDEIARLEERENRYKEHDL